MNLCAKTFEVEDAWAWLELAYEKGWTDGLPVAPPTPERVAEMIRYVGRAPDELLGIVPPLQGKATVEKVAIQAVMAGCRPEYFPVVLAALECVLTDVDKKRFNLRGVQDTTAPTTPLVIVSGPATKQLGFHYRENAFGGLSRANATVGRALRLILWNLGGAHPGETDQTHMGHPGKYSFCVAENPEPDENPWVPLNVEHGYAPEQSTVTVFGCEAPRNILTRNAGMLRPEIGGDPESALRLLARAMASAGSNNFHAMGQILLAIGPLTAQFLDRAGYTKDRVRRHLFEHARNRLGDMMRDKFFSPEGDPKNNLWKENVPWVDQRDPDFMVPVVDQVENIHIIVTGGAGLPWNAICYGWGQYGGYAVTKPIAAPPR
jgi:hypothetical protein